MLNRKKTNSESVLNTLLKALKIRVSPFTVKSCVNDHPSNLSMLSISDCLTDWNVPHEAYKIETKNIKLETFKFPFVAHLKHGGGRFIKVDGAANGKVFYSNEETRKGTLDNLEFLRLWDGILLYAEANAESGEKKYIDNIVTGTLNSLRLPFLFLTLLTTMVLILISNKFNLLFISSVLIKIVGVIVSTLLLIHSVNGENSVVQKLCGLSNGSDCNTILNSNAAKVTSWLSWSEMGMFYFAGSLLYLLIQGGIPKSLFWMNIFCLPYSIYSFWYQIKSKSWCLLCSMIQCLFWIEAATFNSGYSSSQLAVQENVYILSLCFAFPISIWSVLKPSLLKASEYGSLKQQYRTFKYDTNLFRQRLESQSHFEVSDSEMPIVLGNLDAKTVITIVTNPFCPPCKKSHQILDSWLEGDIDIQVKVIFATPDEDDEIRTKAARHFAALSKMEDRTVVRTALSDWYAQTTKNYEDWALKFPVPKYDDVNLVTSRQKQWCDHAQITYTPTILVDGYRLPPPYKVDDLLFFLPRKN